jgi:hypothetical protein
MSTTKLEDQVREVLRAEDDAISLSDKLFSPSGLFSQMANTEGQRRVVARSGLFKQAQTRLSELQRREAEAFRRNVAQFSDSAEQNRLLKLERS